jgi:hypothetical protein
MRALWTVSTVLIALALLVIAEPSLAGAATDAQLHACRNRVMEQYPGTVESNVGATQVWEANGSVRIDWYNGPGRSGTCVVGPKNQMFQFIVSGQSQPPYNPGNGGGSNPSLQNFGNIPHVGQFAAVNNSGTYQNGVVLFRAYVDNAGPSQWGARCADGRLFNGAGAEVRDSQQARYVVAYVCNAGR